jgi:ActR/RegA family two-component response regulator
MKIVIFENEFNNFRSAFDAANLLFYDSSLVFEQHNTFQEFGNIEKIVGYEFAVIDIDLSPKSQLDGYQIIEKVMALKSATPKIIILTGHLNIAEQLTLRGFPIFPIITKPIDLNSIKSALSHYGL